jgi:hypothetical protein
VVSKSQVQAMAILRVLVDSPDTMKIGSLIEWVLKCPIFFAI